MIMCKRNEAMLELSINYCNSVVPILTKTPRKVTRTMEMRLTVCEDFINSENILYSENLLLVYLSRYFVSHKINNGNENTKWIEDNWVQNQSKHNIL